MAWVLSKDDDQPEQKVAPYGVAGMVAQETGAEPKSRWQLSGRKPTASSARPQYAQDLEDSGVIGPYMLLPGGQYLNRTIGKPTMQAVQDVAEDPRGAGMNATRNAAFGFADEAGGFGAGLSYLLRGARDGESLRYVDKNGDIRDRDGIDGDLPSEGFGGYLSDRLGDAYAHGYETWRDINREGKRFSEEKPVAGVATAVAAGLPGGAAAFNATGKLTAPLVKAAPKAISGAVQAVDTAARLGGIGYLTGFGLGEGLEERLNTANTTGAISTVLPLAASTAAATPGALGSAGGYLAKKVLPGYGKKAAATRAAYDAADQAGFQITRGQASGNPKVRQREDNLLKTGSQVMADFNDTQADEMATAAMGKITRGQAPISDSVNDAGNAFESAMAAKKPKLVGQQRAEYNKAMAAAGQQKVGQNQNVLGPIEAAWEKDFLDHPGARNVLDRLQDQVQKGTATRETVERARQAINGYWESAAAARDGPAKKAISTAVRELDKQFPPSAEMLNARKITGEVEALFGVDDAADTGGKAIRAVGEQELTGEQVIGRILGSGKRPNAATLGAVNQVKQVATGTTKQGRIAKTSNNAGMKAFNDPNQQPSKELQALREALVHKLTAPLRSRDAGQLVPAKTIASDLDDLLDGPGADISKVIFTPDEIAALRQYRSVVDKIVPPPGTSKPGTAETLLLSKGNWGKDLVRYLAAKRYTSKPMSVTFPNSGVAKRTGKITNAMGRGLNTVERAVNRVAGPSASTISAATVQADMGDDDSPIMSRYGFGDGRTALDDLLEAQ